MEYNDTSEFWEWFVRGQLIHVGVHAMLAIRELRGTTGAGIAEQDSHTGDIVTLADATANRVIRERLSGCPIPLALLNEEHGVLENLHPNPKVGLVVDELDGTRPFRMGMGTACISIAAYPLDQPAELRNVRCGLLVRLDTEKVYVFVRGRGVWRIGMDREEQPLSPLTGVRVLKDACLFVDEGIVDFALHGFYMRPFDHAARIGMARFSACCYGGVLMVEGGTHAMIITGFREWQNWPAARPTIREVWGRFEPGPQSYDVAALVPLLLEMGCTVTDSFGRPLDNLRIDQCGTGHQVPGLIAAESAALHAEILAAIDTQEAFLLARRAGVEALLFS